MINKGAPDVPPCSLWLVDLFHPHPQLPLCKLGDQGLAGTHLADGRDVILPQYVGDLQQLQIFERVAHDADADFIEIVLLDDRDAAIERFNSRDDGSEWTRHNNELVADLGGDEFLALLTEITQPTDATLIADKMLAALAAPARIGDHLLNLSGSVGIALYPQDGTDAASLIAHADAAMYAAKRAGGGRCALHQPDTPPEAPPESG